jgi:transposase-like protein
MPGRKTTKVALAAVAAMPPIPKDIIDQFVTGPMSAESVESISLAFKNAMIRPLEPMYPVVFFDALRVKIREDAVVRNKAIYLALGILPDGTRDIPGPWIQGTEGAKFWMKVFNHLKTRGVADILIAVTDGLKGMAEALGAVFLATTLQTCIVHLIRNVCRIASTSNRCWPTSLRPVAMRWVTTRAWCRP